jgi:hypothetical protein
MVITVENQRPESRRMLASGRLRNFATLCVAWFAFLWLNTHSARASEILINGGFESGSSPWQLSGPVIGSGTYYHTGSHYLVMGELPTTDAAYQDVFLPANATSIVFSYWYVIASGGGTTAIDNLSVAIRNPSNAGLLVAVDSKSNLNGDPGYTSQYYHQKSVDITSLRGQTVRVIFLVQNQGYTSFKIDDVSVQVTLPTTTAPSITSSPSSQTVTAGNSANFSVAASGSPSPTYQWLRSTDGGQNYFNLSNDSTYSGVTTSTLTVSSTTTSMSGYRFRATANNSAGSATSASATLTVNSSQSAPVVTAQPVDRTVTAGASANFSVSAIGNPTPTYQWQRSTDGGFNYGNLSNDGTYSGVTTTTLTVSGTTTGMSGYKFRVVAANSLGNVTTSGAALTVQSGDVTAPTITAFSVGPNSTTVGNAFTINYTVSDSGGSGLSYAKLWRATGDGSASDPSWQAVGNAVNLSGNGPTSGNFTDTPTSAGNYWYGVHVADNNGNATDERQAGLGPIRVAVTLVPNPTVTLKGSSVMNVECRSAFTEPGATAKDSVGNSLAVVVSGTVDTTVIGNYTLTYSATDSASRVGTATRAVHIVDTTSPTVSLLGSAESTITTQTAFNDPGALGSDTCAGVVTVQVSGAVDVNTVGDYTITYTATDPSGNSGTKTRTVHVTQGELPTGWTTLKHQAPEPIGLMLLLTDGTVIAAAGDGFSAYKTWYKLTNDFQGHYNNSQWTPLPPMHKSRKFYGSTVLRDGKIFVVGGEYGDPGAAASAEIYDPVKQSWGDGIITPNSTLLDPTLTSPNTGELQGFYDCQCSLLPDGKVLIVPVAPKTQNETLIYDPVSTTWSSAGSSLQRLGEAGLVKIVGGSTTSFLTVDPDRTSSERYIPGVGWKVDAPVSDPATGAIDLYVSLSGVFHSYVGEIGPSIFLPNGKALFLGGTGHTAIYSPSGSSANGSWKKGPEMPLNSDGKQLVAADAPCAMMVNGKVLCALSEAPYISLAGFGDIQFPSVTTFVEYDPFSGSSGVFNKLNGPTGNTDSVAPFQTTMLNLPDGTILYSHQNTDLHIYKPSGSPLADKKPTVAQVSRGSTGYHLTGTKLTGFSAGAAYGDDAQMDTDFPLIKLSLVTISPSPQRVYYARTRNWTTTSTDFDLPSGLPSGTYWLYAVVNGISSDPTVFEVTSDASGNNTVTQVSVVQNQVATITFIPSSTVPVQLQWFSTVDGGTTGTALMGKTNEILGFLNVKPQDAKGYYVVVSNTVTSEVVTSAVTTLNVYIAPKVTTQPHNQSKIAGNTASFNVRASGTQPLSYQWRLNGAEINQATDSALTIANVQSGDAGTYQCAVSNGSGVVVLTSPSHGVLKVNPDTKPPISQLTYPTRSDRFTNGDVYVFGDYTTTAPDVAVAGKVLDLGLITNVSLIRTFPSWAPPINTNVTLFGAAPGKKYWTNVVTLVNGTNTFVATATDSANRSATSVPRSVFLRSTDTLTVNVNGHGKTVSVGTAFGSAENQASLEIGRGYVVKAVPDAGVTFVDWRDGSGNLLTNKPTLHFLMTNNLILNANFNR